MSLSIKSFIFFRIVKFLDFTKVYTKKKMLCNLGVNSSIKPDICIESPAVVSIGNSSSLMSHCTIFGGAGIEIGDNVQISANCVISGVTHPLESDRRREQINKKVVIRDNVWIGMSVSILPGVIIGENSIVGAGSVVTKNIPENEIWIGNPARFYKKLN